MATPRTLAQRVCCTLLALAVLSAACATLRPPSDRRSAAEDLGVGTAAASAPLRVFATGDTRGYLDVCGCEGGQVGGVPRRGTYLRAASRPPDLRIDLGNLTAGAGDLRRLRREATLDALALLGYDVIVPGGSEIADGRAFDDAARARGLRVLSANLRERPHGTVGSNGAVVGDVVGEVAGDVVGATVFPASWIKVLPDGRRVAVVGISEPSATVPDGRSVAAPAAALAAALRDLSGRADTVIVATSLSASAARELAASAPGVAMVMSGSTPEPDVPFDLSTGTLVGAVGHLGQYVARVEFGADLRPTATWRAWLDERVADDPELAEIVRRYKDGAAALDTQFIDGIVAAKRAEGYAGSKSCEPCHAEDYAAWKKTLHGSAMRILVEQQAHRDPDCVPCHLVDVPDAPGAFDPDAMGVGCEACHGGSAEHNADPAVRTPASDGGRGACATKCHHPPEVKDFDFAKLWPRIAHGKTNPRR